MNWTEQQKQFADHRFSTINVTLSQYRNRLGMKQLSNWLYLNLAVPPLQDSLPDELTNSDSLD